MALVLAYVALGLACFSVLEEIAAAVALACDWEPAIGDWFRWHKAKTECGTKSVLTASGDCSCAIGCPYVASGCRSVGIGDGKL